MDTFAEFERGTDITERKHREAQICLNCTRKKCFLDNNKSCPIIPREMRKIKNDTN